MLDDPDVCDGSVLDDVVYVVMMMVVDVDLVEMLNMFVIFMMLMV